MKIQYVSDLHIEFDASICSRLTIDPEADVLILAGDIVSNPELLAMFYKKIRSKTDISVVYVPGNHEYYGQDKDVVAKKYRKLSNEYGVLWIDNSCDDIGDISIVGSTLYSDLSNYNEALSVSLSLNDFRVVRVSGQKMSIDLWNDIHAKSAAFIRQQLRRREAEGNLGRTIVVTHFSPSFSLQSERFAGNAISSGFHSELLQDLQGYWPAVWIYGHTHDIVNEDLHDDYGLCRVVTNQYGYPFETHLKLETKIIEL